MHMNNYSLGLNDLFQAKSLSPNDPAIIAELKKFQRINSRYRDYEKRAYKKLFS